MLTAGATTDLDCSLCEAGTYQTGSGQDDLEREVLAAANIHAEASLHNFNIKRDCIGLFFYVFVLDIG